MKKISGKRYFPLIMCGFGTVVCCISATKNAAGLLAARFFLGIPYVYWWARWELEIWGCHVESRPARNILLHIWDMLTLLPLTFSESGVVSVLLDVGIHTSFESTKVFSITQCSNRIYQVPASLMYFSFWYVCQFRERRKYRHWNQCVLNHFIVAVNRHPCWIQWSMYKPSERALRIGIFHAANALASGVGGFIAVGVDKINGAGKTFQCYRMIIITMIVFCGTSWLMSIDGIGGLESWRWVVLIEGIMAISMSLPVYFLLLTFPETTSALNERERHIAINRFGRGATRFVRMGILQVHC